MVGRTATEAGARLKDASSPLIPHKSFGGNRPTTSILVNEISPFSLGSLIGKSGVICPIPHFNGEYAAYNMHFFC